ncbi:hypothetical protein RchiOBHm_Chr5g0065761 [Rosa chinensis]|uniref:Uncharacterized protein n=1 Tax=Rosa chinensis TaxID=74649 RepID=A0A2P6QJ10_ROSCH|nr:hypothetical protein RchiOBHm_Chr5g0065761 [Rosa chinensis]
MCWCGFESPQPQSLEFILDFSIFGWPGSVWEFHFRVGPTCADLERHVIS